MNPEGTTDEVAAVSYPQFLGDIDHLGDNLTFSSRRQDQSSVISVWKPELIAKAQAVADARKVSLETIVQEWELAWAANG